MEWIDAVHLLDRYGLPLTGMVLVSFFAGKALRWIGVAVLAPVVKRHLKFIDQIDDRLDVLAESFKTASQSRTIEFEKLDTIASKLQVIAEKFDGQLGEFKQLVVKTGSVVVVPQSGPKQ